MTFFPLTLGLLCKIANEDDDSDVKQEEPECPRCKEDGDMVEVRPGIWVCNNCGR